ncbi:hypothetical protein BSL78_25290 [Apostichopus japonicus]|uniref:Uncharacterized protein n=1 Tax=Stichopus japonicus TaxID=307972 RepID=A0A2G8JQ32_STIJA|nr:hypothetical protein BSL78_25290 [Apostichopus japonicus]
MSRSDIIIKPADKGSAVVIQDRQDYIKEAMRHLSNSDIYTLLDSDPTVFFSQQIKQTITDMYQRNQISKKAVSFLSPTDCKAARFYLLPKIHKPGNPGRPIISAMGPPPRRYPCLWTTSSNLLFLRLILISMTLQISSGNLKISKTKSPVQPSSVLSTSLLCTLTSLMLKVNFLDVTVRKEHGSLSTDLYTKPTDTHQYLHSSSCHPRHCKSGIAYSQAFVFVAFALTIPLSFAIQMLWKNTLLPGAIVPEGCVSHSESPLPFQIIYFGSEGQKGTRLRQQAAPVVTFHPNLPPFRKSPLTTTTFSSLQIDSNEPSLKNPSSPTDDHATYETFLSCCCSTSNF